MKYLFSSFMLLLFLVPNPICAQFYEYDSHGLSVLYDYGDYSVTNKKSKIKWKPQDKYDFAWAMNGYLLFIRNDNRHSVVKDYSGKTKMMYDGSGYIPRGVYKINQKILVIVSRKIDRRIVYYGTTDGKEFLEIYSHKSMSIYSKRPFILFRQKNNNVRYLSVDLKSFHYGDVSLKEKITQKNEVKHGGEVLYANLKDDKWIVVVKKNDGNMYFYNNSNNKKNIKVKRGGVNNRVVGWIGNTLIIYKNNENESKEGGDYLYYEIESNEIVSTIKARDLPGMQSYHPFIVRDENNEYAVFNGLVGSGYGMKVYNSQGKQIGNIISEESIDSHTIYLNGDTLYFRDGLLQKKMKIK